MYGIQDGIKNELSNTQLAVWKKQVRNKIMTDSAQKQLLNSKYLKESRTFMHILDTWIIKIISLSNNGENYYIYPLTQCSRTPIHINLGKARSSGNYHQGITSYHFKLHSFNTRIASNYVYCQLKYCKNLDLE